MWSYLAEPAIDDMRRVITALVSVADRLVFLFGSGEFPRHTVALLIIRTLH